MADEDRTNFDPTLPPGEQAPEVRGILSGPAIPAIMRLAWPAAASMLMHTLLSITDMFWVGHLSVAEGEGGESIAIAAVISATFVIWIIYCLGDVIATGVVAMISRALGAKAPAHASYVADNAFRFALAYGLLLSLAGIWFAPDCLALMRGEPEVQRQGTLYLQIFFIGAIPLTIAELFSAMFRAGGNTRIPLWTSAIAIGLNIVLDPLLIYGYGPFPRWEVKGAAIASVLANVLAVSVYAAFIARKKLNYPFRPRFSLLANWAVVRRMCAIGLPISMAGVVFSVVYFFLNGTTAEFGTSTVAALGIGNRIESINYMIAFGFSMAVSTMVGQNLGARQPKRAEELTYKSAGLITAFTAATTVLFLLFPTAIARFFTPDAAVVAATREYIIVLAVSQVFMAWEIVFEGAFSGAGDTLPPTIVSIPGSIIRLPLAYFLAVTLGWGPIGIWWTISLTTVVKGIILLVWFRTGRWKHQTRAAAGAGET